ncbi:hypothetical protein DUI87_24970 [Hirundo rustica rustica]|uniref:Uncharacterized protein n=1 Tax=Hirundo rustica rustica TaxID=333673 RepID=A0A3M0JCJ1_HIRRU|nr:hypothetical protein DUI87_24970 [Hirundo rustica rustica]
MLLMDLGRERDSTCELLREDQIISKVPYSMGQILDARYNNARANQWLHSGPLRKALYSVLPQPESKVQFTYNLVNWTLEGLNSSGQNCSNGNEMSVFLIADKLGYLSPTVKRIHPTSNLKVYPTREKVTIYFILVHFLISSHFLRYQLGIIDIIAQSGKYRSWKIIKKNPNGQVLHQPQSFVAMAYAKENANLLIFSMGRNTAYVCLNRFDWP